MEIFLPRLEDSGESDDFPRKDCLGAGAGLIVRDRVNGDLVGMVAE